MLSRQHIFYQQFLQIADGLMVGALLWVAHAIRFYIPGWGLLDQLPPNFVNCYWMIAVTLPAAPMALEYFGAYQIQPRLRWNRSLWRIVRAMLLVQVVLFTAVVLFHIPQESVSRVALGLFFVFSVAALFLRWGLFYVWLKYRGVQTHLREHILLCGTPGDRLHWKQRFLAQPGRNFEIRAEFDLTEESLAGFVQKLHEEAVDIVVFSVDEKMLPQAREALLACEAEGVEAWVSATFIQTLFARVQFDHFAGQPLLIYRTAPAISWELVLKRALDLAGATLLLLLLSPVLLLIALLVKTSRGPVLFSQMRSGLHGRPFRLYKFRTMVTNAEQARTELEAMNEMSGPVFKMRKDPRVTPLGRLLRKTSMDELPQLWNVLRGEMSLVGPRPLPLYETANFGDLGQRRRMSVRPGLTCLWQVSGRSSITDFRDWVRLDLEYIDHWSLWLDFKILLMTVPVVLFGWGAK